MGAIKKSLILGGLVVLINLVTYLSFRFFVSQELNFLEGLTFTAYESVVHFLIITPVSYFFFRTK